MAKSRQTSETAKALVSPFFSMTNAFLKSGEMMLDTMQAATRNVRVAVLPDGDMPRRRSASGRKNRSTRAKSRRRRG